MLSTGKVIYFIMYLSVRFALFMGCCKGAMFCLAFLSFSHCDFSKRTWKMKVTKEWGDFAAA